MDWIPTISGRTGPLYLRIVGALSDDIATGVLHQGQKLPTHRKLAEALGVDLTTVTRAYNQARHLGLTDARVGRGTVVRGSSVPARQSVSPSIDLSMNIPPQPLGVDFGGRLAKVIGEFRTEATVDSYLSYHPAGGAAAERHQAAEWLRNFVPDCKGEQLIIAPGTQAALFALLLILTPRGSAVFTEDLTYPGFKAAAAALGLRLIGVEMDEHGMKPEALDAACREHRARVVYLMPTVHNPTTATMPLQRRQRIAKIIRKHDLTLIEDDPYGFLVPGVVPLTSLIPECSYLAASLSKCISPGLRTSLVVTPDRASAAALAETLRATIQMSMPLVTAISVRWLRDGTADAIIGAVSAEVTARQALAREALAGYDFQGHPNGPHIWLSLPDGRSSNRFAGQLQKHGLAVVTGDVFATSGTPPSAIRLALGAARNRTQLQKAFDILREALATKSDGAQIV
ncbi:PLP-dependent aminotransferase family protein [Hyphomicrobium methylovorum]|uniref:aminotransferase-like domain-containing protein n=1 Tax=Hyphomicrobium methylovorum TaxID=84 RepID=UPI0015E77CA5|nr:PLP-dependent aminotransferase family protein [Hyphomicrobium methylovorum]MBA2126676.1 PLP-dependent aminotransferase family protein [Hyphomicrobium methylovorum]